MQRDPKVKAFYSSGAWKKCRDAYMKYKAGLCENCLTKGIYTPAEIVHHKIHITPDNVEIPEITLSPSNLKLVCRKCHAEEHGEMYKHNSRRYEVEDGKVYVRQAPLSE